MIVKGWERTSLIEYTEHIASVLFCGGCDFRCPMCHNSRLVLDLDLPRVDPYSIASFFRRRRGLVDGVVITGGEPTSQPELISFLRQARLWGLDIKLDTNGYHPEVLHSLLDEGLVDYVAMDIKAPPGKYSVLAGIYPIEIHRIDESINLIRSSGLPYEFRTTVVPGLLDTEDIVTIARWLHGARRYVLQQFRPLTTLDPSLEQFSPYPQEVFQRMAGSIEGYVHEVHLRGMG